MNDQIEQLRSLIADALHPDEEKAAFLLLDQLAEREAVWQEALKFYADPRTYHGIDWHSFCNCGHPENHSIASGYLMQCQPTIDDGAKAREALEI